MIDEISIKNLRSLEEKFVKIKPLTVLVGNNSSGKSSFLRIFPLLRQSVESKTTGPILWFGRFVDYGAFSEAKSRHTKDDIISFSFKLNIDYRSLNERYTYINNGLDYNEKSEIIVKLSVTDEGKKHNTVLKSFELSIEGIDFIMNFEKEKLTKFVIYNTVIYDIDKDVNSSDNLINGYFKLLASSQKFLPTIAMKFKEKIFLKDEFIDVEKFSSHLFKREFSKLATIFIKEYFSPRTKDETIFDGLNKIGYVSNKDLLKISLKVFKKQKKFINRLNDGSQQKSILMSLTMAMILNKFVTITDQIDKSLVDSFLSVRYIAPLRATAQRFYRFQDLEIEEIDHEGSNVPMFIYSLNNKDRKQFEAWTKENLGFVVKANGEGLHYSLTIKLNEDNEEYNLSDMGFGFSQTLPIIISLWTELIKNRVIRRRSSSTKYFIIEQPELHLHPDFQSKLARLFVNIIKFIEIKKINIKIIFETHSNVMIESIGESIEEGLINKEDVSVIIFDKKDPTSKTNIKEVKFDDNGYLLNWPLGFFSGQ
ncbi:MAG: DUF3696 domain-containing protein [Campylobacteraceae bacterium]|nr:DUF3696 domain-containing protein [Campylobacteraceae bacterium]